MQRFLLQDNVKPGSHLSVSSRQVTKHFPVHWHNYIELELITDGNGWQKLNGQHSKLNRGSICLLRLTDFHELAPEPEMQLLNLSVDESFLSEDLLNRLNYAKNITYNMDESQTETMETLIGLCMKENERQHPNIEYLKHLLACIMLQIIRLIPNKDDTMANRTHPIQSALLYLHMHFRENPSLSKLAQIAHYNTSHFSTIFHKELGMNYTQYLNMLKTDYAIELLKTTNLKVTDICYKCGFSSHSNFLRLMHNRVGCSPTQFRKQHCAK